MYGTSVHSCNKVFAILLFVKKFNINDSFNDACAKILNFGASRINKNL